MRINENLYMQYFSVCVFSFEWDLVTGWFLVGKTWSCFLGFNEKEKNWGRNRLPTQQTCSVRGTSVFSFAGQSLICCQPFALIGQVVQRACAL